MTHQEEQVLLKDGWQGEKGILGTAWTVWGPPNLLTWLWAGKGGS